MRRGVLSLIVLTTGACIASCSGSSSGNGGNGGSGNPGGGTCQAQAANMDKQCPSPDGGATTDDCDKLRAQLDPIGCSQALDTWLSCTATAKIDCATGDFIGCDSAQNGYFACQSQFTGKTGCSRIDGQDAQCGANRYAFGCVGATPSGCTPFPQDSGTMANLVCCPAFPP